MGDGETFQTEGAYGVAKWKEGTGHIQNLSPHGTEGWAWSKMKPKRYTGARSHELYIMEENTTNIFYTLNLRPIVT